MVTPADGSQGAPVPPDDLIEFIVSQYGHFAAGPLTGVTSNTIEIEWPLRVHYASALRHIS